MCIDYRNLLHLPKNCAYVIRTAGANMNNSEFPIALALSSGIRYMALIAHNKCLMSDPYASEQAVLKSLSSYGWSNGNARVFFNEQAVAGVIRDPVDFVLRESDRIASLFKGLTVVPLLYCVDDSRLYLLNDWIQRQSHPQ